MKKILIIFLILLSSSILYSQNVIDEEKNDTAKIDFTSEVLEADPEFGSGVQRLTGNVIMIHDSVTMTCDTAFLNQTANNFLGIGNVHLNQGDTIDIWAEQLFYDGNLKIGNFRKNVIMKKDSMTMNTDSLDFDLNINRAYYEYGARSGNNLDTLISLIGIFDSETDELYFRTDVEVRSPEQTIYSDTLIYNTKTNISTFLGPTEILGDSNYIYCENGWYNHELDIAQFNKNAFLNNGETTLKGDSLYYDRQSGFGKCFENVSIIDTAQNMIISGKYGLYYEETEFAFVTDSALFKHIIDSDTIYLHADTLITFPDTAFYRTDSTHILKNTEIFQKDSLYTLVDTIYNLNDTIINLRDSLVHFVDSVITTRDTLITTLDSTVYFKYIKAYKHAKLFKSDFQLKSDSLTYSTLDSTFKMYQTPILWSDSLQVTADSIFVFTHKNKLEHAEIMGSAFAIMQENSLDFNQVKGKNIFAYFNEDELFRIDVKSEAKSIFFVKNEDELVGINKAESVDMQILRKDGEIEFVKWYQKINGALYPSEKITEEEKSFEDFKWRENEKPLKWQDIFIWDNINTLSNPNETIETPTEKVEDEKENILKKRLKNK